jgi:hypothetical protein
LETFAPLVFSATHSFKAQLSPRGYVVEITVDTSSACICERRKILPMRLNN